MRAYVFKLASLLLALTLAPVSCGGFDNRPLRFGTVRGSVRGAEAGALVFVFGEPEVRAALAPDGSFELTGVPAGSAELMALASPTHALRFPVEVHGGRVTDIPELVPQPAAFVELRISTPDGQSPELGTATVRGTLYQAVPLLSEGTIRLGPLAAGAYTVSGTIPGLGERSAEFELEAGEVRQVVLAFPTPDWEDGRDGCLSSGCSEEKQCAPDGSCVECLESAHCDPGLACVAQHCVGP